MGKGLLAVARRQSLASQRTVHQLICRVEGRFAGRAEVSPLSPGVLNYAVTDSAEADGIAEYARPYPASIAEFVHGSWAANPGVPSFERVSRFRLGTKYRTTLHKREVKIP